MIRMVLIEPTDDIQESINGLPEGGFVLTMPGTYPVCKTIETKGRRVMGGSPAEGFDTHKFTIGDAYEITVKRLPQ